MKVKVKNLTPEQIDWLVATIVGIKDFDRSHIAYIPLKGQTHFNEVYSPSTNPAQGAVFVEGEGIASRRSKGQWYAMMSEDLGDGERAQWCEYTFRNLPKGAGTSRACRFTGPTQLIAAMRCLIAFRMGDTVVVPEDLV